MSRTHATEEHPFYYLHPEGQERCACDFPQIWLSWPFECRSCGRIIPGMPDIFPGIEEFHCVSCGALIERPHYCEACSM